MADDLKRVGLVFKEDGAVDFRKSLQLTNAQLRENYNQFKLVQTQWDASTSKTQKLKAELDYLNNAYDIQKDKVSTLRMQLNELENADEKDTLAIEKKRAELTKAETSLQKYANQIKEVSRQLKITGEDITKFGENIEKVGGKIEKVGQKVSAFSTATATAFVACAKTAIDFEDAFTGVEKTVDGTEEQMAELKQGIRDMAKEIPSTTTEIAAVAEAAGQLGIQTENILSFSKAMIDLGNSTNLTADEAASQLAKFANIMQMSQKDFDRLGSSIVDLGNNFATTEADIVDMSMRLAGAGKQVGLSEGQVLGLATALSSVGIEAEMGGSAISKAMVKMQNAVEVGGGKLNDVLKKSGKSLRDLELMSANDSKSFKELSQSLGLTSTELKQMITAGTNLEDFAKVSGMTAEKFKKAWKEDAAGALSSFIKGLGDAENKGESAISMLSEMGLTEVRLRDSLLRAANAGDLFNNAIATGTKAWEDNTALTNEANKRYDTLKSKLTVAINKLKDMAITVGNKLMPTVEKAINSLDKVVKKFDSLNDEQLDTIINIGKIAIVLGPAITMIGKLTTGIGGAVKAFGTYKTAMDVAKGVTTSTDTAVNLLAGTFGQVVAPVGLAIAAVGAYTVALLELTTKENEASEEIKNTRKSLEEQKNSWNDLQEARDEYINKNSSEIVELQNLRNELEKITDENGKVKAGYEERANFIVNKLKEATGQEISMNDGVIQSYQEVQKAVDETLRKKQAELLLSAYQAEYTEALKNRSEAVQNLATLQSELNKKLEKQKEIKDTLEKQKIPSEVLLQSYSKLNDEIENINSDISKANEQVSIYGYTLSNYAELQTATANGTAEDIEKALGKINVSYEKATETAEESYTQQINYTGQYVSTLKTLLQQAKDEGDTYRAEEIKNELDTQQTKLKNLEESFKNEIFTIDTMGEEQVTAFQNIADNDRKGYMEILNNLDPDTQELLKNVTNSISSNIQLPEAMKDLGRRGKDDYKDEIDNISNDTETEIKVTAATVNNYKGVEIASGNMATNATNTFDNNNKISQKMQEEVNATANVENNDSSVGIGAMRLAGEVNSNFNNNVNGWQWGADLVENIVAGLSGSTSLGKIAGAASRVAGKIAEYIHHSVPDEGPLKDELEYMPDMIDNLVKTLYQASPRLEKATADVAGMMADNLNPDNLNDFNISTKHNSSNIKYSNAIMSAINSQNEMLINLIQKQIDILQEYFPQFMQNMNQPIVTDDGAIIAHFAPLIDNEMGRINSRKERGS